MQSDLLSCTAQTFFSKAASAGLTNITCTASKEFLLNYRAMGRKILYYKTVAFKGSQSQENVFKASLVGDEFENLEIKRQGLSAGDECPDFKVFNLVTGEEVHLHWALDDPKVYLLDFWASWCGPCKQPMNGIQEMLERHPEWKDRTDFLGISLDDDKETPAARIRERGWTKLSHYWGGEGDFGSPPAVLLDVNGIPELFLVKRGKILWRGSPAASNLEDDITLLMTADQLPMSETSIGKSEVLSQVYTEDELQPLLSQVEAVFNEFVTENRNASSPFFVYVLSMKVTESGTSLSAKSIIGGSYISKFKPLVESTVSKVQQLFPNPELHFGYSKPIPTIIRGRECSLCAKVLTDQDTQYLCPYCAPKHYHCQACEDHRRPGQGSAKLAHPHKLYKITSTSSHFDELRYGINLPIDHLVVNDLKSLEHPCRCDNEESPGGCDGKVEGARYQCAHCRNVDLCEACERLFWGTATEAMKSTLRARGHEEWHVLIKIPFPR